MEGLGGAVWGESDEGDMGAVRLLEGGEHMNGMFSFVVLCCVV